MNTLSNLINTLKSKYRSDEHLLKYEHILSNYTGNDWIQHIKFCDNKYKRNVIYRNDIFEVLLICWKDGQSSNIHDHPMNGCLLKILKGELIEEQYIEIDNNEYKLVNTNVLRQNDISYLEGTNGLHQIVNISGEYVISLHIYSPPNYTSKYYE